jgi:hypothetical protein
MRFQASGFTVVLPRNFSDGGYASCPEAKEGAFREIARFKTRKPLCSGWQVLKSAKSAIGLLWQWYFTDGCAFSNAGRLSAHWLWVMGHSPGMGVSARPA